VSAIDQKPTHAYIGRRECGCVMAVASDTGDAEMYDFLARETRAGLNFTRVTWAEYQEIADEKTFMACNHGQLRLSL